MALATVAKSDCNALTITNLFAGQISYVIALLNPTTFVYDTVYTGNLADDGVLNQSLADGIWKITITAVAQTTEYYIKTIFCSLEDCYVDFFSKAVCDGTTTSCCDACNKEHNVDLAVFSLMLQVYFSLLKYYENFDSSFATFDATTIADLVQLSKITTNLYKYCNTCNCGCS